MDDLASRWLTYDDMAEALGITPDSARRLATRHKWPRRPGNDGRALVAVPGERLDRPHEPRPDTAPDDASDAAPDVGRDARALIGYLERRVGELTGDLVAARRLAEDARAEAREARRAAEALHVKGGQVEVLTALVAAERAHLVEVRGDRDRLAALLSGRRAPWLARVSGLLRGAG